MLFSIQYCCPCPIVQIDQNSQFYLYAHSLFAGSGSGTLIPDPDLDPGQISGSMRILIHNTVTKYCCIQCCGAEPFFLGSGSRYYVWLRLQVKIFGSVSTHKSSALTFFCKTFEKFTFKKLQVTQILSQKPKNVFTQSQQIYLVLFLTIARVNKYNLLYKICTVYKEQWTALTHFLFHLLKKKPVLTKSIISGSSQKPRQRPAPAPQH